MPAVQSRVSKASEFSFEGVFSTTHNIRAIFEALSSGSIAGFLRLLSLQHRKSLLSQSNKNRD